MEYFVCKHSKKITFNYVDAIHGMMLFDPNQVSLQSFPQSPAPSVVPQVLVLCQIQESPRDSNVVEPKAAVRRGIPLSRFIQLVLS